MCFNTVILNPRNKDVYEIVEETKPLMSINHDGFAVWAYWYGTNHTVTVRTLDKNEIEKALELVRYANVIHIHYRLASSGGVTIENVHMWDVAGFRVSHNGFVNGYSTCSTCSITNSTSTPPITVHITNATDVASTYSDTYQFVHDPAFADALKSLDIKSIANLAKEKSFYGVLFATSPRYTLMLSRGKSIKVTVVDDVLVFSNEWYVRGKMKLFGMEFNVEKELLNLAVLFDNEEMKPIATETVPYEYSYWYYRYYGGYYEDYDKDYDALLKEIDGLEDKKKEGKKAKKKRKWIRWWQYE